MSGNNDFNEVIKECSESIYTNAEAICEALIFAAGEAVDISDIANVLIMSKVDAETVVNKLMQKVNSRNGGVILRKMDTAYRFCTRPELYDYLRCYFERPQSQNLTKAASETLAVIAYMQPVTRAVIESIRGVNCDSALTRLLERELIYEVGKAETPGRPILYGTTELFLESAGISSLSELPKPKTEDSKVEQMNMFEKNNEIEETPSVSI